ncbi:MAG: cbb3-type cytochrome c oxidase N-terminal domain-containing protein [Luteibaculaceae bacterium]
MTRLTQPIILTALIVLQSVTGFAADGAATSSSLTVSVHTLLAAIAVILLFGIFSLGSTIKTVLTNNPNLSKPKTDHNAAKVGVLVLLAGSPGALFAAETPSFPVILSDPYFVLLAVTDLILLFIFIQLFLTAKKLIKAINGTASQALAAAATLTAAEAVIEEAKKMEEANEEANAEIFGFKLTDHVAIENEKDILLDHDYDGIKELDNNLPPWWVYMFYATMVFAVVYIAWFHVLPYGMSQEEEYIAQMEEGERQKELYLAIVGNKIDESSVELLTDQPSLNAGKDIYIANCMACHANDLGGGVGPNLVDNYWLHGGSVQDVFKVIKYGVPTKGMIPWQGNLTPLQMQQVTSYILSMQGTEPANPKDPQGELYAETEAEVEVESGDQSLVDNN